MLGQSISAGKMQCQHYSKIFFIFLWQRDRISLVPQSLEFTWEDLQFHTVLLTFWVISELCPEGKQHLATSFLLSFAYCSGRCSICKVRVQSSLARLSLWVQSLSQATLWLMKPIQQAVCTWKHSLASLRFPQEP